MKLFALTKNLTCVPLFRIILSALVPKLVQAKIIVTFVLKQNYLYVLLKRVNSAKIFVKEGIIDGQYIKLSTKIFVSDYLRIKMYLLFGVIITFCVSEVDSIFANVD